MGNIEMSRLKQESWALFLDPDGYIAEGAGCNFFIVKNGYPVTPEPRNILRGISRDYIIQRWEALGNWYWNTRKHVCIDNIEVYDVFDADEAFVTATPFCVLPVVSLDGVKIGDGKPGKIYNEILEAWSKDVGVDIKRQIEDWDTGSPEGVTPFSCRTASRSFSEGHGTSPGNLPRAPLGVTGFRAFTAVLVPVLLVALPLARRNRRLGRSDSRGGFRIAVFAFLCDVLYALLRYGHARSVLDRWFLFAEAAGAALFDAATAWALYVALEPYVRRRWPQALVSWSRVLSGRFADPLVGRDLLVSGAAAACSVALFAAAQVAPLWRGRPVAPTLFEGYLDFLLGVPQPKRLPGSHPEGADNDSQEKSQNPSDGPQLEGGPNPLEHPCPVRMLPENRPPEFIGERHE